MKANACLILANFGGPRSLNEIEPFLTELLTDRDVIQTPLPARLNTQLFRFVARKRAPKVAKDYAIIGGKSPIYADTESLAEAIREQLPFPVITFHRYLSATHDSFIQEVAQRSEAELKVLPLFPQFTYATTGSLARWMQRRLPKETTERLQWIKSYPDHPSFVAAWQSTLRDFLNGQQLNESQVFFLFSAHGIPKRYVRRGDPYRIECRRSYQAVMEAFPNVPSVLAFQSKFGPGEWLRPYTSEVSTTIHKLAKGRQHIVFVPISFTSDHIETLFEIEQDYMPEVRVAGLSAYRAPALTLRTDWIRAVLDLIHDLPTVPTDVLVRG